MDGAEVSARLMWSELTRSYFVNVDDVQRLSWTVTQRTVPGDQRAEQAFEELVESCRELCRSQFPAQDGYDWTRFELSGPVQGTRFEGRRGRLRVVLSVQRFERSHATPHGNRTPTEIRLVGSMGLVPLPGHSSPNRSLAGWGVAGCALGTLGVSALALGSAGMLSPWIQAALLVPALIAWRTCAAIGVSRSLRRQAAIEGERAGPACDLIMDALPRWRRMAPALAAERDLIGERLGLPPFRNPARALRAASSAA